MGSLSISSNINNLINFQVLHVTQSSFAKQLSSYCILYFMPTVYSVYFYNLLQANQFFLGTSKACSLAYKTYIYSKVDREHYQRVTAIIRIAPKAGTLFSSILSQTALSIFLLNIDHLNMISLAGMY